MLGPLFKDHLTVLCYHRVLHSSDRRFPGYKPVISASHESFSRQMDFVCKHYNPISLRDLVYWLDQKQPLPPSPILITFDDGYRDNAEVAWPIMRDRGVPAVIFLATDYIGTGRAFIWDQAAYLFDKASVAHAHIPLIGFVDLSSEAKRDQVVMAWVQTVKRLPGARRAEAMERLATVLDIKPAESDTFRHLYLDWAEVDSLARQGVEFGAHTGTHPILTSLPLEEAVAEINNSVLRLTEALGSPPLGFAYPNGSHWDYSTEHEQAVVRCGIPVAFTLEAGPMPYAEVQMRRTAIRRIYIGPQDNMPRFIAKLTGLARIRGLLHRSQQNPEAALQG